MKSKSIENALFKLDLLECKFHELEPPRFNKTQEICHSRKNNYKLLEISEEEAEKLIKKYQHEQFELKYDEFLEKSEKILNKLLKQERKSSEKFKEAVDKVEKDETLKEQNIKFKLDKTISKIFKRKMKEKSQIIPKTFYQEYEDIHAHNPHESNPKEVDTLFSKLFGKTMFRDCMEKLKVQFKLILGPVRQEHLDKESVKKTKRVSANNIDQREDINDAKIDIQSASEETGSKHDLARVDSNQREDETEAKLSTKEDVSSKDKDKDEEVEDAGSNRPIAEVDDFFKEDTEEKAVTTGKANKKKIILPAIMSGYYSGDEDADELEKADKDNEVQNVTLKHRKNRRGQRARRKIWEKKYGKMAKHLVKERGEWQAKQQRLEQEYEVRVEKRAEKQKKYEEWVEKQKEKKKQMEALKNKPLHPSWTAKRKLEESLANVKFEGKKQKFA